jgi:hypothetical protein
MHAMEGVQIVQPGCKQSEVSLKERICSILSLVGETRLFLISATRLIAGFGLMRCAPIVSLLQSEMRLCRVFDNRE